MPNFIEIDDSQFGTSPCKSYSIDRIIMLANNCVRFFPTRLVVGVVKCKLLHLTEDVSSLLFPKILRKLVKFLFSLRVNLTSGK